MFDTKKQTDPRKTTEKDNFYILHFVCLVNLNLNFKKNESFNIQLIVFFELLKWLFQHDNDLVGFVRQLNIF